MLYLTYPFLRIKIMRYQIGQKLLVVAFSLKGHMSLGVTIPLLYDNDQPEKIFILELTVKEHHRVPNHYDPKNELACDGYVLTDASGTVFHNQYPRANYGQLSDDCDRQFELASLHMSEAEITALLDNEHNCPIYYELLDKSICRILKGIEQLPQGHEKVPHLNRLLIAIEAEARKTFPGFTYEYVPVEFKNNDGTVDSYPDIKHVVITIKE